MILNGYDTLVGSKFKISDHIASTIKTLATTNRLTPFNGNRGLYSVTSENGDGIPSFVFPITLTDYRGQLITIFDQRNYVNSAGRVVNAPEYAMIEAATALQQMAAKGDKTLLLSAETYTVKAFARSIGGLLARQASLDLSKRVELEIILGHYYNCLLTNPDDDYAFVSQNVLKRSLNVNPSMSAPIIEEVGYVNTLKDLVNALKSSPRLPTLSKLSETELVSVINRIWYAASGFKMIIGASVELPHLFTAICFATVTNNIYRKTEIGRILDPKDNPNITGFIQSVTTAVYN